MIAFTMSALATSAAFARRHAFVHNGRTIFITPSPESVYHRSYLPEYAKYEATHSNTATPGFRSEFMTGLIGYITCSTTLTQRIVFHLLPTILFR